MNRIIMLSVLVLSAILAVSLGDPDELPICSPDQWEGTEASIGGYVFHRRPGIIKEHNFVSYDAKNKRKASFITYVNNEYENKFQMLIRYDNKNDDSGKAYVVDLKKNKCWTKSIKYPFRKACVPADAKKIHSYSLGLKGDGGLEVTGYVVKKKDFDVYMAVAKLGDNIIPVTENVHGHFSETSFIQGMEFADITAGIKNETVFDVPKQCDEYADTSIAEYLLRENFILAV